MEGQVVKGFCASKEALYILTYDLKDTLNSKANISQFMLKTTIDEPVEQFKGIKIHMNSKQNDRMYYADKNHMFKAVNLDHNDGVFAEENSLDLKK